MNINSEQIDRELWQLICLWLKRQAPTCHYCSDKLFSNSKPLYSLSKGNATPNSLFDASIIAICSNCQEKKTAYLELGDVQ